MKWIYANIIQQKVKNGLLYYKKVFYLDKEDVKKLPINCKPGSAAICLEDGSVYMMNSKHEWKEI